MVNLKTLIIWIQLFTYTQCAVLNINEEDRTHQVVLKRIGNYATDVHYHHICIPVNLTKIIETLNKAIATIETYVKNVYHKSLIYYKDNQWGNLGDKDQAHLAAQLIKNTSEFITNTLSDQFTALKNSLLSINSMLPTSSNRPERQLERIFGLGAILFSLYYYINQNTYNVNINKYSYQA
jgi:hypothetical protein